jgi:hypothetical protein
MKFDISAERDKRMIMAWRCLTPKRQTLLLDNIDILLEMERPSYQRKANAIDEEYRLQMVNVEILKTRIEKVSMDVRKVLLDSLPAGELTDLLITQELLAFLRFAAEYKPFYLFEEDGTAFCLAEKTIRSVERRLKRIEKRKV